MNVEEVARITGKAVGKVLKFVRKLLGLG